jgi:hypothetical protein
VAGATAGRLALGEATGWAVRLPDDTGEWAALAAGSLAIGYAARAAETLELSPLQLRAGLTLPPGLLLLAQAYHVGRG